MFKYLNKTIYSVPTFLHKSIIVINGEVIIKHYLQGLN